MKKLLFLLALSASFLFAGIDINTATAEEFAGLKGIGKKKAEAIVKLREKQGGKFSSVEDLLKVKGIGKKTLANIKGELSLGKQKMMDKTSKTKADMMDKKSGMSDKMDDMKKDSMQDGMMKKDEMKEGMQDTMKDKMPSGMMK